MFSRDLEEEFEDTKGVIRIRKSKDRHHNGQTEKDKRTNTDQLNITHKSKDRVTRMPLNTGGELRCSENTCTLWMSTHDCISMEHFVFHSMI